MRAATAVVSFALALAGCGYSTRSLLPGGARRVAVDVFGNETFYRRIEFTLTRELTGEIRSRTPYVVTRRRNADVLITGRIVRVRRPTLIETQDEDVSEQAVIVTAEVRVESLPDHRPLDTFLVSNRAEFIVERGETLDTAFSEALRDLAERIVDALQDRSFLQEIGREATPGTSRRVYPP